MRLIYYLRNILINYSRFSLLHRILALNYILFLSLLFPQSFFNNLLCILRFLLFTIILWTVLLFITVYTSILSRFLKILSWIIKLLLIPLRIILSCLLLKDEQSLLRRGIPDLLRCELWFLWYVVLGWRHADHRFWLL